LKIVQARLEGEREETEEEVVEHFRRWAQNPKAREAICGKCLSPEEREQRIRQIFGLSTVMPGKEDQTDQAKSSLRNNAPSHRDPCASQCVNPLTKAGPV
jgi:hypothetical protein